MGSDTLIKARLSASAATIRAAYLKKPIGKSNVTVAEIHIQGDVAFSVGATSRGGNKSPIPQPKPKSEGGQFEPTVDSRTHRLMDTDAEYKVLSTIADQLEILYDLQVEGNLYLYTELQPCESCENIIKQFQMKFPNIKIEVFWDYPYP
ncbi:deaminase domain-containing protein [Nodularia chucula]|uniref:deaminase domain-containing protein n=1 Tax=Nodularia chucula TaxID=3093667 RepID=UPI0039C5C728